MEIINRAQQHIIVDKSIAELRFIKLVFSEGQSSFIHMTEIVSRSGSTRPHPMGASTYTKSVVFDEVLRFYMIDHTNPTCIMSTIK